MGIQYCLHSSSLESKLKIVQEPSSTMNPKLIACLLLCSILLAVFHDSEGWRRRRRRRRSGKMDESAVEVNQDQKHAIPAPHVRDSVEQMFDNGDVPDGVDAPEGLDQPEGLEFPQ